MKSVPEERAPAVTLGALFLGFLEIALSSFGGVLAWARRVLVERRGWLSNRQFAELLGICQVLPGGNIINLSVCYGARVHGPAGSLVALAGLVLAPLVLVLLLATLYAHGAHLDAVHAALRGAGAVTVGLLIGNGLKLSLAYRREPWAIVLGALAFVAVGLLRWPLIPVLVALAPCGVVLARWKAR